MIRVKLRVERETIIVNEDRTQMVPLIKNLLNDVKI